MYRRSLPTKIRQAMGAREYISETVRAAVFHSDNGKCYHCSKKLVYNNRTNRLRGAWHIEHLVAHSKGGSDSLNNLRAACIDCNLKKSNKSVSEWNRQDGYAGRCQGKNLNGQSCSFKVAVGNIKYCQKHGTGR